MDKDIRWLQRFENLEKAISRLQEALDATQKEPSNHLYQIALIGAFQFTFELSWKTLKDFLKYNGIDVSLPRDVIKQSFHHNLINDGMLWIEMLEDRNLMPCLYQEDSTLKALKNIQVKYAPAIIDLHRFFKSKRLK